MANKNRDKGHRAEREFAKEFRELGYKLCRTSREASRLYDNAKIDLWGIPFNVQVKAGYKNGINHNRIFNDMRSLVLKFFGEEGGGEILSLPCLIIHRKDTKKGHKRAPEDTLVTMSDKDFNEMFKGEQPEVVPQKRIKKGLKTITFKNFKNFIHENRSA